MGEITRLKHGLDDRRCIESVAAFGGSHGEEAEGIGIEAVELALAAEALNNGLSSGQPVGGVEIGELANEAAEAGGVGEVCTLRVQRPRLLSLPLLEECEEPLILGIGELVGRGGKGCGGLEAEGGRFGRGGRGRGRGSGGGGGGEKGGGGRWRRNAAEGESVGDVHS